MEKVDEKKTLAYAVAFIFCSAGSINFVMGKTTYQHIQTIYDRRSDNGGFNTLEVVYNYKAMRYEVINVSDDKVGNKEISILSN